MRLVLIFTVCAGPVWAACGAGEQTFMSCDIADRAASVAVCFDDQAVYYRFGVTGKSPELALSAPVATVDYAPWSRRGSDVREAITFTNAGYAYAVYAGFQRWSGEDTSGKYFDPQLYGGVRVTRGGEAIATFKCDPASVNYTWRTELYDMKTDLGLGWNDSAREWVASPD